MTNPSAADSATAGSLDVGKTYQYSMAKITLNGESQASATPVSHVAPAGGGIDVSWTAESDAIMYKIYRTEGDGASFYHLANVPAYTYDSNGDPVIATPNTGFTDTIADSSLDQTRTPHAASEEEIFLIDFDKYNSYEYAALRDPDGEVLENLFNFLMLGRITDRRDFLVTQHGALALKGEVYNSVLRRVKAS
jgi:hypothetical protein